MKQTLNSIVKLSGLTMATLLIFTSPVTLAEPQTETQAIDVDCSGENIAMRGNMGTANQGATGGMGSMMSGMGIGTGTGQGTLGAGGMMSQQISVKQETRILSTAY